MTVESPSPGITVSGSVIVAATAADDIGVSSVQFLLDGAPLGIADTEAPYEAEWVTTTAANGAHTMSAVAQDAAGHVTTANPVSITAMNDVAAPSIGLVTPAAGGTVDGVIVVSATAADDVGVTSVQFLLDGAPLGAAITTAPYQIEWPTTGVTNTAHALTAVARDAAGRETTATTVIVNVRNDVTAPTVVLASPSAGTVTGSVTITATAVDDVGVTSVQFLLDGAPLGAADLEAPYEVAWSTLAVANGAHTLTALARDGAGRETTAEGVNVTVLNDVASPTVTLTTPSSETTLGGTVVVRATATDDVGVTSVQFLLNGAPLGAADLEAPYEVAWPTLAGANGAYALTAVARDAAGRETTAAAVNVSVLNDLAAPAVALASPAAGATVSGSVIVTATAADDVGVTSVQFLLNGAPLGAADLEAPYEVAWPTLAGANGAYALTAVARDAAGRETTAAAVNVSVVNDLAAPTVVLVSPAAGTTVQGAVSVTATAADDIGVSSVQFLLDGAPLGAADLEAPYEVAWPTASVSNGAHALTAVARDAAGRETTATAVNVSVLNDLGRADRGAPDSRRGRDSARRGLGDGDGGRRHRREQRAVPARWCTAR